MSVPIPIDPSQGYDYALALFREELTSVRTDADLQALRNRWVGRKGSWVAGFMDLVSRATPDAKRLLGRQANDLKRAVEAAIAEREAGLAASRRPAGAVDVTLPGRAVPLGRRHPVSLVRDQVVEIFTRLGYQVLEGPEVEDDYHNFEALNMPPEHPARDMQDTLYLVSPLPPAGTAADAPVRGRAPRTPQPLTLLRTHTSAMQIRHMEQHDPPVRLVGIGPVYRRDNLDLTHTPMFHQVEGLVVGSSITLADLKGTLTSMATALFGEGQAVRFRPSFFPYTEPSAEVDIRCIRCQGNGCAVCKRTGWVEILGSGMVHPSVFEYVGYDPDRVTGFAFGMGIERVALLKWDVDDIRLFYDNDLRFLEQFAPVKVLLSWIRDFVDVPGTPEEIGARMSLRGLALEGIEPVPSTSAASPESKGDAMLDFDVTANRPDCLSIRGIAREIAAAYGLRLNAAGRAHARPASAGAGTGIIPVTIEDPDLCRRYVAAMAEVTIGPSPEWMQTRLSACGVRPISNVVDVTNYVLLELGQPMHAFDFARLRGPAIVVRRARAGEALTTLDGKQRTLDPDMLVIADAERASAIGGVMGGADSEVSAGTTRIVFESAWFNPQSVRATSKRLGLRTEASYRFERGADLTGTSEAMTRALALLESIGAGRQGGPVIDVYPRPFEEREIALDSQAIERLLGMSVPVVETERILTSLGFGVRSLGGWHAAMPDAATTLGQPGDRWQLTIPAWRVDINRPVDLIEEVGRHYGFEHLPTTFPAVDQAAAAADPRIARDARVRRGLLAMGFSEAISFAFIESPAAAPFLVDGQAVELANPLSEKFTTLRPSLLPGLVDAVSHNRRHGRRDVRLFEIGTRFSPSGETRAAGAIWTGIATPDHWSGARRDADFFDIKGAAEQVVNVMGVAVHFATVGCPFLVAGRAAGMHVAGELIGVLGQLDPAIAEARDLPGADPIYVLELDLDKLSGHVPEGTRFARSLPRHPSVVRDVSILLDDSLSAETVRGTIRTASPPTLVDVREFDRYQGKGIADGKVSLSLRLTFQAPDRTLTDAEVRAAMEAIVGALTTTLGAVQR